MPSYLTFDSICSSATLREQHQPPKTAAKIQSDGQCYLKSKHSVNERSGGNTSFSSGNVINQGANRDQNREGLDGGGTVDRSHLSALGFAGSVSSVGEAS